MESRCSAKTAPKPVATDVFGLFCVRLPAAVLESVGASTSTLQKIVKDFNANHDVSGLVPDSGSAGSAVVTAAGGSGSGSAGPARPQPTRTRCEPTFVSPTSRSM